MPLAVDRGTGLLQVAVQADGLDRIPLAELPPELVAVDEVTQPRVEGHDVIILQIDLDEGLPVVVALVHLDVVEPVAGEVEIGRHAHAAQVGLDVARALEEQTLPLLQRVAWQLQAGLLVEVRGALETAVEVVGPAVQRTDDTVGIAGAIEHDGLAVATDIGEQFDAAVGVVLVRALVDQHAAFLFGHQGTIVAPVRAPSGGGHGSRGRWRTGCAARAGRAIVKVGRDRQLGCGSLDVCQMPNVRHDGRCVPPAGVVRQKKDRLAARRGAKLPVHQQVCHGRVRSARDTRWMNEG